LHAGSRVRLIAATLVAVVVAACPAPSAPRPPREPLAGQLVTNEFLPAPASTDANLDGVIDSSDDEFVELVSTVDDELDLSGVSIYTGTSGTVLRHSFAAATLAPHKAAVIFGGGLPALSLPSQVIVLTASSGALSLADDGATIELRNSTGTIIDSVTYGAATPDVSSNRNPELTGSFVDFTSIPGSVGHYSPGKRVNGTSF